MAPAHHSAPETGALAKTASGALERQPYLRMRNLSDTIVALQGMGYLVLGLDGEAEATIEEAIDGKRDRAVALVLGCRRAGSASENQRDRGSAGQNRLCPRLWVAERLQRRRRRALCGETLGGNPPPTLEFLRKVAISNEGVRERRSWDQKLPPAATAAPAQR